MTDSVVTELNLTFLHFFFILAIYYNVMGDPNLTESSKSPASIACSNKQWVGTCLYHGVVQATPDKLRSSYSVMKYHKEGPACGRIPYDPTSSEADCEYPL